MKQKKLILELILISLVSFLAIGCVEEQSTEGNVEELSPEINVDKPSTDNNVEKPSAEIELLTTYHDNIPSSVYNLYPKLNNSLVSYEITNNGADILEVTVSSEITGYTDEAINKKQISPGETVEIPQTPLFKPGVLDTLTETKTANLHFKVIYAKNSVEKVWDEQTIPITLYAKDTMVWGTNSDAGYVDLTPYVAAWVTPHSREIDELVRRAAEYNPQKTMGAAKTPEERCTQVNAIYDALKNGYYITYISSPISYTNGVESSQRIKLPRDAINLASANCIDGTVLFASALENIGMDPDIVIIPGHAFLVWEDGKGNIEGAVETTMVGNSDFYDAYVFGLDEFNEQVNNGNFENGVSSATSVKKCRALGITPMQ